MNGKKTIIDVNSIYGLAESVFKRVAPDILVNWNIDNIIIEIFNHVIFQAPSRLESILDCNGCDDPVDAAECIYNYTKSQLHSRNLVWDDVLEFKITASKDMVVTYELTTEELDVLNNRAEEAYGPSIVQSDAFDKDVGVYLDEAGHQTLFSS